MIDAKNAVEVAKQIAATILGPVQSNLEEIERERYKEQEVWSITLSLPRDTSSLPPIARLGAGLLQYKRFLIDVETGELVAMKIRELASQ